jgi:tetratricopeptide (TPR) repeat protein
LFSYIPKTLESVREYPVKALLIVLSIIGAGLGSRAIASFAWAEHHYQAAVRALDARDFAGARAHLASCLQARPLSADTHFLAARAARRALDYAAADRHLAECRRLGGVPELIELERDLARAQQGDLVQVEARLKDLVERGYPDDLIILEALCRGYLQTYRLVDAMHALEHWLERQPNDVQALIWRAEGLEHLQKVEEALEDFRRALELAPDRDDDRLHMVEVLIKAMHPEEAARNLLLLSQRRPRDPKVLLAQARCLRLQGKPTEAIQVLDQALLLTPADALVLTARGRLELEEGRPAAAEPWLRKAVALAPYERETVYALFNCLQRLGRAAEAAPYEKELEKIENALDRLSQLAMKINSSPNDPALRYEAGMIFLKSGQAKEGLRWLSSALQVDPAYAPVHQTLADYYESIGDFGMASQHRHAALGGLIPPARELSGDPNP